MRCMLVAPACAVAVAAAAVAAPPARAEPRDLIGRPLVLARGAIEARLVAELSLRPHELAAPISLAPDVWLGVAPRWTVGLVHSAASRGLIGDGATLCFRGRPPHGCERAYGGSALDVRWGWREGALAVAPRARLVVRDVDPWKPAVTTGALVRWTRGRFAIAGDPYLQLGLAGRARGNRAALVVPIWLAIQPTCRWMVAVHTGWDGELAVVRDGWHGPLGLAIEVRAAAHLHVGALAGFRSLVGPQSDPGARTLAIGLAWRP